MRVKLSAKIDFFVKRCYNESMILSDTEVLEDMQINGLKIVQDTRLYRFTSDSVLLTRFARAKKGDIVADFCAGSGIVAFHFHALNADKSLPFTLFEMQESLLSLAKKTAEYNGFENFAFTLGKLQDLDEKYREKFSLVLCNPPYEKGGFDNESYEKAVCRKELTINLRELAQAISKALKFGGRVAMLHRADRIAEVCYTLKQVNIEVKRIQFVSGKAGAKPYLVMIEAVKGGKPACEIMETIYN